MTVKEKAPLVKQQIRVMAKATRENNLSVDEEEEDVEEQNLIRKRKFGVSQVEKVQKGKG